MKPIYEWPGPFVCLKKPFSPKVCPPLKLHISIVYNDKATQTVEIGRKLHFPRLERPNTFVDFYIQIGEFSKYD